MTAKPADASLEPAQHLAPPRTISLGGGLVVPYPEPSTHAASSIGKANRRLDTKPEILIRSALHRRGLRFRKNFLLRVAGVRVRPDLVFTRRKVAVFIDGCFWHACPDHGHQPVANRGYWGPKLERNAARDARDTAALQRAGWLVLRFWEHVAPEEAAEAIRVAVNAR